MEKLTPFVRGYFIGTEVSDAIGYLGSNPMQLWS